MDNPISDFFEELSWTLSTPSEANSSNPIVTIWNSPSNDTILIFVVLGSLLFFLVWFFYDRYQREKGTPYANEALVGYYVKFSGKVAPYNYAVTPIKEKKCEFFRFKIIGERSVKAKKPSKGIHKITKLLSMQTTERFLVKNEDMKIFVELKNDKDIKSTSYKMKTIEGLSLTEIRKFIDPDPKYTLGRYIINYLVRSDIVTIHGKLIKRGEEYIITDTYDTNYPFKIERGDQLSTQK